MQVYKLERDGKKPVEKDVLNDGLKQFIDEFGGDASNDTQLLPDPEDPGQHGGRRRTKRKGHKGRKGSNNKKQQQSSQNGGRRSCKNRRKQSRRRKH
jgi:hypothetical protein